MKLYYNRYEDQAYTDEEMKKQYCKQIMDGDTDTSVSYDEFIENCTDLSGTFTEIKSVGDLLKKFDAEDFEEDIADAIRDYYRNLSRQYLAKCARKSAYDDENVKRYIREIAKHFVSMLAEDFEKIYQ